MPRRTRGQPVEDHAAVIGVVALARHGLAADEDRLVALDDGRLGAAEAAHLVALADHRLEADEHRRLARVLHQPAQVQRAGSTGRSGARRRAWAGLLHVSFYQSPARVSRGRLWRRVASLTVPRRRHAPRLHDHRSRADQPLRLHVPGAARVLRGPSDGGSPNATINGQPILRMTDRGHHQVCCGPNKWQPVQGSAKLLVNGIPVVRMGDKTIHCGGYGQMKEGSSNVVDDSATLDMMGAAPGGVLHHLHGPPGPHRGRPRRDRRGPAQGDARRRRGPARQGRLQRRGRHRDGRRRRREQGPHRADGEQVRGAPPSCSPG